MADNAPVQGLQAPAPEQAPPITPLNRTSFVANQTPFVPKERTDAMFRADLEMEMKKRYSLIALESSGAYRVGIPVQDFFDEYMPWNKETTKTYKDKKPKDADVTMLREVAKSATEADMYKPFVSCDILSWLVYPYILDCRGMPSTDG